MDSTTTFRGGPPPMGRSVSQENTAPDTTTINFKKTVANLSFSRLNNMPPKIKLNQDGTFAVGDKSMDKLIAKISKDNTSQVTQLDAMNTPEDVAYARTLDYVVSTSAPLPITPTTDVFIRSSGQTANTPSTNGGGVIDGKDDVDCLRAQLQAAHSELARLDLELTQSRITSHTLDQVVGNGSDSDFQPVTVSINPVDRTEIPAPNGTALRPGLMRDNSWQSHDDVRSETSDTALSAGGLNSARAQAIWNKPTFGSFPQAGPQTAELHPNTYWNNRSYGQPFIHAPMPVSAPADITTFRAAAQTTDRALPGSDFLMAPPHGRRGPGRFNNRNQPNVPYAGSASSYDGYTPTNHGLATNNQAPSADYVYPPVGFGSHIAPGPGVNSFNQFPAPIGTPLSPHAPEFTSVAPAWKQEAVATEGQTYLPTTEPMNYRRLLDRTVNCNWKYIVDKIVCNNDQQASIFLQQKLKVGTTEQKYDIVEAIVAQAYPLMINRFGNFLVQRCFEHGTPQQVIKIAEAIRGNTLNLSMDAFGCHVIQKAFDSVPEDYKAIMVGELLRRIPETVIHRYACHVWQKLFELRWTESPPQIMQYVNEALRGMWHEVALGETGSLVVQNIFENCLEEDKRPCIEEVLASIDIVAHGQFGNWCIQHICEHGAPADRSRAIDHVIRYASEYSMDQFASKVVEKCLKIGGIDFLGRYLDRVCEGRHDRPRIPLIDIASDQYGNYLIQYILTHSNPQHREIVAQHIRKHMVSLRGSKFGSRVGMLCTNPAIQTRPGPGIGPALPGPLPRMGPQAGPRYGNTYH